MIELLNFIDGLSAWVWQLPRSALFFAYGVLLTYTIAAGGYALARSGVRPLWVLLLLIPTLNIIGLWLWAYCRWPRTQEKS